MTLDEITKALPSYGEAITMIAQESDYIILDVRRPDEFAKKPVKLGYTNIAEFGGILDWTGDVVTTER